ncbi:MAG: hypothetical protein MZV70_75655 [Desulfobacterales bacterium]|nr:hypothetical protein [Desulfobacterales bacterium]
MPVTEGDRGRADREIVMGKAAKINGKKRMPLMRGRALRAAGSGSAPGCTSGKMRSRVQGAEIQQADDDEKSVRLEAEQ